MAMPVASHQVLPSVPVHLVKGSRKNAESFIVERSFLPDECPKPPMNIVYELAGEVEDALETIAASNHKHEFHAGDDGHSMLVKCVCLGSGEESPLAITTVDAFCFRPTAAGGHSFGKSKDVLRELVHALHHDLKGKDSEVDSMEILAYAARFANANAIFIFTEKVVDPTIFAHIDLCRNEQDEIVAFEIRLNDAHPIGKSTPKLSDIKWSYLFPEVPLDKSLIRAKRAHGGDGGGDNAQRKRNTLAVGLARAMTDTILKHPGPPEQKMRHAVIAHVLRVLADAPSSSADVLQTLSCMDADTIIKTLSQPAFVRPMFKYLSIDDEDMLPLLESMVI